MRQGDASAAEVEFQKALQLDPTNTQATSLLGQIRQAQAAREREGRFREALQQSDNLVAEGKFDDAQRALLELQQEFPDSAEIDQKLLALDQQMKLGRLMAGGQSAFDQGEFGEAVRILTEAQELDPNNERVRDLKVRAVQQRDRLRQVREAISAGQRAMRQGDAGAAEREYRRALQLDPANTQATNLLAQVQIREALQQSDNLVAEGKFDDAQHALLELQQEFPDSTEIDQKLLDLEQQMKLGRLMAGSQSAFDQGEFGEAVRILTEAQELDPNNERVRDLMGRAVQQRDRLRQVREAISAGQRAMRQGDAGAAEREYGRALQLDPANTQATNLLAQVQKERQAREREQRLKEGLSQAEKLISGKKFDEAQRKLTELQQAYPDAEEVPQKLLALSQRRAEAAAPPPPPAPPWAPVEKTPSRGAPVSEAAKSMQLAEELRRSLQTPRPSEPSLPAKPPAFTPTIPMAQAPPPPPPVAQPQVQAPPPTPAPPRVEPRKPAPAPAPPRVTPAPPVMAREAPKKSPMILVAVIVLVVVMGIGAFLFLRHPSTGGGGAASTEETQLETDAKGLQDKGDLQGALGKWQELAAKNGTLKKEADSAVADLTPKIEKGLFDQAKAAQDQKNWDGAIALYSKVADMSGPLKDQALAAIPVVKQQKEGLDDSKIEKQTFGDAMTALKRKQYTQARGLFQQVVSLKVPDSTLVPQAQSQLANLEQTIKAQEEFDAAERAANKNDLDGALAQFDRIASGGGPFATRAKARIPELQKMKSELAANAALKQELDAAVQAESNNDLPGALDKFKAIAAKGGTFGSEATKHIQEINDKLAAANADRDWKAALQAESSNDLNGALGQFKAIAAKSGPYKDQAQTHVQTIGEKLSAQADQQKFDDAVKRQNSGDLPGALAEFKALAGKPGAKQAEALDRFGTVSQLIADASKKPTITNPGPSNPGPSNPGPSNPGPSTPTTSTRNAKVELIPTGEFERWNGPVTRGQMMPDNSVEGGLKSIGNLSVPPMDAPAKAVVIFMINIDPNGNVTPGRKTSDDFALGPQVMAAAKGWKFNPPMVRGKAVQTNIQVKVSF
jgi:Flp pilus assembly protein TadD